MLTSWGARIARQASLPRAVPTPSELYDRAYFESELCEGRDRFRVDRGPSALKRSEVDLLAPVPGLRVLDAGCGRGGVLLACARAGALVADRALLRAGARIAGTRPLRALFGNDVYGLAVA